jgi:hypothetical protein
MDALYYCVFVATQQAVYQESVYAGKCLTSCCLAMGLCIGDDRRVACKLMAFLGGVVREKFL